MPLYDFPWDILAAEDAQWRLGTAGERVLAGQVVYYSKEDRRLYLASNATPRAAEAVAYGIAMDSALIAGQPLQVLTEGSFVIGLSAVTPPEFIVGMPYMLDAGPGQLVAVRDQPIDVFSTVIGVAQNVNRFAMFRQASGVLNTLAF